MPSALVGFALLLVAVLALAVRYVPIDSHAVLYVAIASPYLMATAPVALVVLAWGRHWVSVAVAASLVGILVAVHAPSYFAASPDPESVPVRVMTANLLYGHADSRSVTELAVAGADVVMLQELNPDAVRGLSAAGLDLAFPHRVLDARPGAAGVGLYSRYPITEPTRIGGYLLAMVSGRIQVDGVARAISVMSLHLAAPWPRPVSYWRRDISSLPATLADLADEAGGGAVLVAGDFNATVDMRPFQRLLTDGYRDAAQQAGDGRNLTFPANRRFPPVMGIDHVLTRNATAVSTSTVTLPATDHRAVLTTVLVPRG